MEVLVLYFYKVLYEASTASTIPAIAKYSANHCSFNFFSTYGKVNNGSIVVQNANRHDL